MKKLNIFFAVLATTVIAGCGNSGYQPTLCILRLQPTPAAAIYATMPNDSSNRQVALLP